MRRKRSLSGSLCPILLFTFIVSGCGGGGGGGADMVATDKTDPGGCTGAGPGTAELSWIAPTTNQDGSPVSLKEFRIYCADATGNIRMVGAVEATETSTTVIGLEVGTSFFAVSAVSVTDVESGFSNIEGKTIQ